MPGADAVIVSNHGGRQLDGALSSIRMLPPIVRAVGDQTEVWMDGGIRSGQDVLKALALGAKGTMIGRAYIHGLGAMGEAGVTKALEVIRKEMDITMALCGERDVQQHGPPQPAGARGFRGPLGLTRRSSATSSLRAATREETSKTPRAAACNLIKFCA